MSERNFLHLVIIYVFWMGESCTLVLFSIVGFSYSICFILGIIPDLALEECKVEIVFVVIWW